jgi:hypothetical protein
VTAQQCICAALVKGCQHIKRDSGNTYGDPGWRVSELHPESRPVTCAWFCGLTRAAQTRCICETKCSQLEISTGGLVDMADVWYEVVC